MAEPDNEGTWSSGFAGCGVWLLLIAAFVFGGAQCEASRFDPGDLRAETGVVESAGGFLDLVTVRYDDGRQKVTVTMAGQDEPAEGSRVRLEWWDDSIIALYDPKFERRYKTTAWPERWDGAIAFLALAVLSFAVALIAFLVERHAARSKGKP